MYENELSLSNFRKYTFWMNSVELILYNSMDIADWGENVDNWLQINDIACSARAMTSYITRSRTSHFTAIFARNQSARRNRSRKMTILEISLSIGIGIRHKNRVAIYNYLKRFLLHSVLDSRIVELLI